MSISLLKYKTTEDTFQQTPYITAPSHCAILKHIMTTCRTTNFGCLLAALLLTGYALPGICFGEGRTAGLTENLGILGPDRKVDVLGQDGVTPIALTDDLTMWTFGDTILGSWKKEVSVNDTFDEAVVMTAMLSNSLAFTPTPGAENVPDLPFTFYKENGRVVQVIKNHPEESPAVWRFWAIDGVNLSGTVYLYYMIITIDPELKPFPFVVRGTGLARWDKPPQWRVGEAVEFKRLGLLFDESQPTFGDSVLLKDRYIYLIGHGKAAPGEYGIPVQITRVRPALIEDYTAYSYLRDDGSWTCLKRDAGRFLHDVAGECSLSFNRYLNKYVIIYCQLGSGDIIRVVFDNFATLKNAEKEVVYTPPALPKVNRDMPVSYYSGKEIFHTKDAIYAIYIQPAIYQPILLRIPY